jgi:hypothetical protein
MEAGVDVTRRNLIEWSNWTTKENKGCNKSTVNIELESKRLDMERYRMKYEHELRLKQMEIELARINVVEHRNDHK